LTDVKQFLFNEIKEVTNDESKNKDDSDDDSDDSVKNSQKNIKNAVTLVDRHINKEMTLSVEDKQEVQSVIEIDNKLI
jgi:hypothetical protein